jgi:hypothetical protein
MVALLIELIERTVADLDAIRLPRRPVAPRPPGAQIHSGAQIHPGAQIRAVLNALLAAMRSLVMSDVNEIG